MQIWPLQSGEDEVNKMENDVCKIIKDKTQLVLEMFLAASLGGCIGCKYYSDYQNLAITVRIYTLAGNNNMFHFLAMVLSCHLLEMLVYMMVDCRQSQHCHR